MEKVFEALEDWLEEKINEDEISISDLEYFKKLKQALTELQAIKEAKPSVAIGELETLKELFDEFVKLPKNKIIIRAFDDIKQALLEFKSLDLSLRLPSEQSSSHFTYKDKNLVCMQLTKYSKLMNAFLEYEKVQELEKENSEYKEVLRIIFEKKVNMFNLKVAIDNNSLRLYNSTISNAFKHLKLTQEEFELLNHCFGKNIQKQ